MNKGNTFIERLRFEANIYSLEFKRGEDTYTKRNSEYENNPTPENREKRAIAWKNFNEAFDKSCAAWKECNHVMDVKIAAFKRDTMGEKSPLKVTFIKDKI